ncbi:MAG: hypothetical protein H6547_01215 [Chitinophagales bacterium]|nr:hypothetical protein [Chitinophagales bacterium]HQU76561.1 hypothetical protein [Chitinophagales bacterium]
MFTVAKKSRWIIVALILSMAVVGLSSCHTEGCPNKITQVNPFGADDVS